MKVAYNNCFGGFSLSPLAQTEYMAKKGVSLTWYKGAGRLPYDSFTRINGVPQIKGIVDSMSLAASTADLGESVVKIPDENYHYMSWYGPENRHDPDLIEVIERLGLKANGMCAELAIKEIPDGVEYEITEYDGAEDVVPPRMSW